MTKSGLFVIAAVAILTLLSLVYFALTVDSPEGTTTLVIEPPVSVVDYSSAPSSSPTSTPTPSNQPNSPLPQIRLQPQQEPASVAVSEPEIVALPEEMEPVELAPEPELNEDESNVIELPTLTDSDPFVFETLQTLQNGMALVNVLAEDQIVRKFVVFVENISRGEFPQTGLPYKGLGQEMPVSEIDDNLFVMDQVAHSRFDQVQYFLLPNNFYDYL